MFGAFRLNDSPNEVEYVVLSRDGGVDARGYTLLACNLCRARKLKCSGDRGGCRRCLASSAECTYGPDGDGYRKGSTAGRSKSIGSARQRRRQTAGPPSSSTTNQHGRMRIDVNVTARRSLVAENGDAKQRDAIDRNREGRRTSPSALPDSTKSISARPGSSSYAPPRADWSTGSDWLDFNDFTDLNGESPIPDPSSPILLDDRAPPVDAALGLVTEKLPPVPSQPSNLPARESSTPSGSAGVSLLVSPSPLTTPRPALSSQRTSPGPTGSSISCQCLTTLAAVLERLGRYRLGDKPKTADNLDCLLFCLGSGIGACNKVLSCKICDACKEHSILLATIAKQLAHICNDLCGCLMAHQHKARSAANAEGPSTSAPTSISVPTPTVPGNHPRSEIAQQAGTEAEAEAGVLGDGGISFGRYQIQGAEMRLRLIQNLMALHMTDLLALLDTLSQLIGQVDGANGMLTDARKTAYTARWMLQQLQSQA